MTVGCSDDERFMREALVEACAAAAVGEVPIGAVVVHEGRVIARAHNRRELNEDPSAHAEFAAMMEASRALGRWRLTGCTVYVTLEPCLMCAGLMLNARIDRCVYGAADPKGGASRALGRWRLTGCTVYVTLEPCLMCAGLMLNARIDRCVYGAADPKGGAVGTLYDVSRDARLNHAFEVRSGVLGDECAAVLSAFFRGLRGRPGGGSGAAGARGAMEPAAAHAPVRPRPVASHASARQQTVLNRGVVLAIDSFKGSASSEEVEAWLAEGMRAAVPELDIIEIPMADGGEGTMEAFRAVLGGEVRRVAVSGPFGGMRVRAAVPELDIIEIPMADGGEGTMEAFRAVLGGEVRRVAVSGPFGGMRDAAYLAVCADGNDLERPGAPLAVIEMAQAAGIAASPCTNDSALAATTRGVGELLLAAVAAGARTVYVGLGGSATTDGGAGMLQALGARLLDGAGNEVGPGLAGLGDVASIDLSTALDALAGAKICVLSDVRSPLVGARGAVRVFGPQKGLGTGLGQGEREELLSACDRSMAVYAGRLTAARDALDGTRLQVAAPGARPKSLGGVPGAGAAGGLGAAFLALGAELTSGVDALLDLVEFDELARGARAVVTGEGGAGAAGGLGAAFLALGAELTSGVDALLDLVEFDELARGARAVVTGEGFIDAQTAEGKVPAGVARRAKHARADVPVYAVCGSRAADLGSAYAAGIDAVLPIGKGPQSLEEAIDPRNARENLVATGETLARLIARSSR